MGSKTRLGSYCIKRANNGVNLVTSRNINTRLARPIVARLDPVVNEALRHCYNVVSTFRKRRLIALHIFS